MRLGYQGDFAFTQNGVPTDDPSLWFSFQHFPSIVSQNDIQTTLVVWDIGDSRVLNTNGDVCAGSKCYSRAVSFQYDQSSMVANIVWQDLPGMFSLWGGCISQLENTNVEFDVNAPVGAAFASEVQEVTQTSTPQIIRKMDIAPANAYSAYRVPSLYPGVTWQN